MLQTIVVLGSTGSIGVQSLDVISRHLDQYRVSALVADKNVDLILSQCIQFQPDVVGMADHVAASALREELKSHQLSTIVFSGDESLEQVASTYGDTIINGVVGAAGLKVTISAVQAGKKILIANKETLVMFGFELMKMAKKYGATIIPLDSEHNGLFLHLADRATALGLSYPADLNALGVTKITITGSGGPFLHTPKHLLQSVTPEEACAHPNWSMGVKNSIDSATMMNKGLEFIEASVLFNSPVEMMDVLIHPQSIVHSMVECVDGSIVSQLSTPDMRVPIAHALSWPNRIDSGSKSIDFSKLGRLDFFKPDENIFPALRLAREALIRGGTLPTIMNGANEIAVQAFLKKSLSFDKIVSFVEEMMNSVPIYDEVSVESVLAADLLIRQHSLKKVSSM